MNRKNKTTEPKQKGARGIPRGKMDAYQKEMASAEVDLVDEVLASRRNAWRVALGLGGLTFVAFIVAGATMLRYSQPLPQYIMTLDKSTGEMSQVSVVKNNQSLGEATDRYWVSQWVIHRMGYDFYSGQADYNFIQATATHEAADDYMRLYQGPNAPDKKFGASQNTQVQISSVILDRPHGTATVRFTTTTHRQGRQYDDPPKHWIATLGYEYRARPMNAAQRLLNPGGFSVKSFHVNPEMPGD